MHFGRKQTKRLYSALKSGKLGVVKDCKTCIKIKWLKLSVCATMNDGLQIKI